ncbi:MAG: YpdA family putative bacillithiol disulfide reductase [Bacteroidetes bacterium SB0662_bin_6]|nr:YpdA family putative bacillithiol disulfide reductase [Bacteroidetes bacterium SB0668_bin_1]MYE05219.1 YpdA family putative bacillithiol disulfide reductase [Bacteroidetes bacterium SB0662_bin_6]
MTDVVIVGAGPVGLACAIRAQREGLRAVIVEKGTVVQSLVGYPVKMEFFSTPELIEIGGHPFPVHGNKPLREEAIEYYRRVAQNENIDLRLYERVRGIDGECDAFRVVTDKDVIAARRVVIATGFFDYPNLLHVPGEDLPKVTHYYKEPYPYFGQRVAVIGARNSAAKAALDCSRHGAHVTLLVRGTELSNRIKYWIKPDLENRIKQGAITARFETVVREIRESSLVIEGPEGVDEIGNDYVLALTGYHPDYSFLETVGIETAADEWDTPIFDPQSFETTRKGVYIAGTVCGGRRTGRWFIENGRVHAQQIMRHIAGREFEPVDFEKRHWITAE